MNGITNEARGRRTVGAVASVAAAVLLAWGGRSEAQELTEAAHVAGAKATGANGSGLEGTAGAEYRVWGTSVSGFDVAPDAAREWDEGLVLMQRLRVSGSAEAGPVAGFLEGDALYGTISGSFPEPGSTATEFPPATLTERDSFVPRKAYVEVTTPVALLRLGHQTSQWGLGLLANEGAEPPMEMFGQRTAGDLVERALVATRPFLPLAPDSFLGDVVVAAGIDLVYSDENASLVDGDRAVQYVGTIVYKTDATEAGGYAVLRNQEDEDGRTLDVLAVDVAARTELGEWSGARFRVGAEAVWLEGETNRTEPWNSPEGADVRAFAAATELESALESIDLALTLGAGYCSGDSDLDDGSVNRFRLDPDYNVGLVLFDHYIYGLSAAAIDRAMDPGRSAVPPDGLRNLVTQASVENAAWLAPEVTWGSEMGAAAGALAVLAWSPSPLASPYETFAAGGDPRGFLGAETEAWQSLGVELDASARYRFRVSDLITLEARAEGGVLFPGTAFDGPGGAADPVSLVQGRFSMTW